MECEKGISSRLCLHLPAITSDALSAHYNKKETMYRINASFYVKLFICI